MKIAIIAGSNRKESTSTKLCRYIRTIAEQHGHEVALIDLNATPLPLYSPDDDSTDSNVQLLKDATKSADAIVLSSPEYHGSVSGVLKNAIDYLGFEQFDGKAVLSVSSTGGAVGVSTLQQLQTIVRNVHGINCPEWISIGGDNRKFADNGEPESENIRARVHRTVDYFLKLAATLR